MPIIKIMSSQLDITQVKPPSGGPDQRDHPDGQQPQPQPPARHGDSALRTLAEFTYVADELTVAFNGSTSTETDGSVVSHSWNFGDTATATGATPSHTYAAPCARAAPGADPDLRPLGAAP